MFVHKLDKRAICQLVVDVSTAMAGLGAPPLLVAATTDPGTSVPVPDSVEVEVLGAIGDHTTFAVLRLARLLRDRAPDVVFAHHNGPARAAVVARILARSSARIVTVEHNHYSSYISPTGGGHSLAFLRDRLTRHLYGRADCVAGVSPGIVEDLVERFGDPTWETAVLPDPGRPLETIRALADEPVDHPWYAAGPDRPRLIVNVANVIPRKGQRTLVEALPAVRERAGDVRLVLVGRIDNPGYADELRATATDLGVADRVDFVGYRANPVPWMAGADVFALASFNEGCPRVLSEAMAAGVPVVASDCPSGPAFITDGGRAGLLVPPGDAAATAAALVRVLTDPGLADDLVERGRARSIEFTPRRVARAYLATARRCMGETDQPRRAGVASPQ